MSKTYRLFISHSWAYINTYDTIIRFFEEQGLSYYDHSVPKDDPIHTEGTDSELYDAIESKIRGTSGVIVLAGVYATYSRWIEAEIEIALDYDKPIIAVEPWGSERTSRLVKDNADDVVKWQGNKIVDAIKELC
ncbi:MAG: molecular chaperone Tir [Calditrichaeota bacterium]|nr:MAG: molecular chaperone Tir [Calditrichota bacterium]